MGKRSDYDLRIFNVSDGLDIPIDKLIEQVIWKSVNAKINPRSDIYKQIALMRLEPINDRHADAKNTYKSISQKFNLTPERIRQIMGKMCRKLERRHSNEMNIYEISR